MPKGTEFEGFSDPDNVNRTETLAKWEESYPTDPPHGNIGETDPTHPKDKSARPWLLKQDEVTGIEPTTWTQTVVGGRGPGKYYAATNVPGNSDIATRANRSRTNVGIQDNEQLGQTEMARVYPTGRSDQTRLVPLRTFNNKADEELVRARQRAVSGPPQTIKRPA